MNDIDVMLYRLLDELKEAGHPLDNLWFGDGALGKHTLAFAIKEKLKNVAVSKAWADEPT
jgi:hypothetical protein